jgi:Fungal Zn(2)-Cys(6) binuclear cluster domain
MQMRWNSADHVLVGNAQPLLRSQPSSGLRLTLNLPPEPMASSTRQKSCHNCVKAKRRCDLAFPRCSRCVQKQLSCDYSHVSRRHASNALRYSAVSPADFRGIVEGQDDISGAGLENTGINPELDMSLEAMFGIPSNAGLSEVDQMWLLPNPLTSPTSSTVAPAFSKNDYSRMSDMCVSC